MIARRTLLPLLSLAVIAACDDSTAPASGGLSASEARALAVALDNSTSLAVEPETAANGPALALLPGSEIAAAVGTHEIRVDVTVPCPRGGTARLEGQQAIVIDTEQQYITVDVLGSQDHEGCVFRTGEGVDVTIDGVVEFEAARELREGLASASQSHSGSLEYSTSDGKAGTCPVNISTSFVLQPGSASRLIEGSVCGHSVDVETTWTASAES